MRMPCIAAAVLLTTVGCAREANDADTAVAFAVTASASTADGARAAASIANAIAANPAGADSILRAAGHTRDSFQKMMYEIAADSAMSAAYAAAKGR